MANNATNVNPYSYPYNFGPLTPPALPRDNGLYTESTTQLFAYGTRCISWDGRVWKYAYCGETLTQVKMGVHNYNQLVAEKTSPSATVGAAVSGDTELTLTVTAGQIGVGRNGIIAKDALFGGFISIYTAAVDRPQRMIIGNDALAAAGTSFKVYIDEPVVSTITALTATEIMANPYTDVRSGNDGNYGAIMGMPNIPATTAYSFWIQTWGICRVSPSASAYGVNDAEKQMVFDNAGAVYTHLGAVSTMNYQHAGFIVERITGVAEDAAPFVMLQISI